MEAAGPSGESFRVWCLYLALDDELAEIYDEIEEECEDEHNQSTQRQGPHPLQRGLYPEI